MKNKFALLAMLLITAKAYSQRDSLAFEDDKDAKDFSDFRERLTPEMVDSLNAQSLYDASLYEINEKGEIVMDDVSTYSFPKFDSDLERKYYYWLKKKLYEAYPYYLKAVRNYDSLNDSLERFQGNRKIRKYIKNRQKELADEYEDKLKNLSRTEGQILSKLIHRQTKKTSYEIIKELRGSFNAFLWETQAKLFDITLKKKFDPDNVREDYYLEVIIRTGIRRGELETIY